MGMNTDAVQRLYVAYFNRPADPASLAVYEAMLPTDRAATQAELQALAEQYFSPSAEYTSRYDGMSAQQIINTLYQNLFGREAEPEGLLHWSGKLIDGSETFASIALQLSYSAQGTDADAIAAKIRAANAFTDEVAGSTDNIVGFSGNDAAASSRSWLAGVTDSDTADTAVAGVTAAVSNAVAASGAVVDAAESKTLTANIDEFTTGSGDDTFTGNTAAGVQTLTALDQIDGGAGSDTLNITTTAAISSLSPAGSAISNIETISLTSNADISADTSVATITGTTQLTASAAHEVALTAGSGTDITATSTAFGTGAANSTIDGGNNVTYTVTNGLDDNITIGGTTAPGGAITVSGAYGGANGITHGDITTTGGTTVSITMSTDNAVNTTNTFGAVSVTGGASTTAVTVNQDAAATAAATVKGVVNGAVDVLDANRASATKAGSITDVTIGSGAAVTINSGALENIYASGKMTSIDASTLGALTTAAIDDIHLHVNGLTTTGAVTFDTDVETITINGHTAASTIASLVDASADTVNIIGDAKVTISAHTLAADAVISSAGSTGGAVFSSALGNGVTFTGGAGTDAVTVAASTQAITMGGGNDTVTMSGSALGYLGTADGGDGVDTLSMTAANAITASATTTFEGTISGFERLTVGAATAGGTVALANLDDINYVTTADVATGQTLTLTGATSGFTLVNNAGTTGTGGITVTLADATGSSDELNVSMSAAASKDIQALTATGFEVINFSTDDSATTATGIAHVVSALTAGDATTITVSGDAGLNLTHTGTKVTSFDASGVTKGAVTWTTGALAAAATITGGAGANTINTSASSKAMTVTGGAAVDTITTGAGNDTITTAAGNDVIVTGNGVNTVDAGAGNDNITGGTGVDTIDAGAGNDTIAGGGGADTLNGGAGNDSITGGSAADTIDGGDGTDTFTMDNTEQAGSGTVDGSVINLGATALTQSAVYAATGKFLSADSSGTSVAAGTATYLYSNESTTNAVVVDTLTGIENVTGTAELDYIVGSAGANTINAGAGNDVLTGGAGIDTFVRNGDGSTDGSDTITDFVAGNGGDVIDLTTNGATDTGTSGEIDTDGFLAVTIADGDGTVELADGMTVIISDDTAAGTTAAQAAAYLADVTGDGGSDEVVGYNDGEVAYIAIATDAGEVAIYEVIDSDNAAAIVAADLTLMVVLTGVDIEDLVAANFADFGG